MKECGPIEAGKPIHPGIYRIMHFPHLKECGPIEALIAEGVVTGADILSALERVRPH